MKSIEVVAAVAANRLGIGARLRRTGEQVLQNGNPYLDLSTTIKVPKMIAKS
jgi:hypothetical protein